MLLEFKHACTDKNTGRHYKVGDQVEFDDKRGKEILADKREMAVEVKEKIPEQDAPKPKAKAKRVKK